MVCVCVCAPFCACVPITACMSLRHHNNTHAPCAGWVHWVHWPDLMTSATPPSFVCTCTQSYITLQSISRVRYVMVHQLMLISFVSTSCIMACWDRFCVHGAMEKIDDVGRDPSCLESCNCTLSECSVPTTVISVDSDDNLEPAVSGVWLQTPLYELTKRGKGDDTYWLLCKEWHVLYDS